MIKSSHITNIESEIASNQARKLWHEKKNVEKHLNIAEMNPKI